MAGNLQFLILQRLVAAHPLINGLISGSVDEEDAKRSFAEGRSQTGVWERGSSLTTHHSPLTTHLLTTHHSLTHHSPLTTHPSSECLICSSAATSSAVVWKRNSGALASILSKIDSKRRGRSGCSLRGEAGGSSRMRRMVSACESPAKGGRPMSTAYTTLPRLKMSARWSTGWLLWVCSGEK